MNEGTYIAKQVHTLGASKFNFNALVNFFYVNRSLFEFEITDRFIVRYKGDIIYSELMVSDSCLAYLRELLKGDDYRYMIKPFVATIGETCWVVSPNYDDGFEVKVDNSCIHEVEIISVYCSGDGEVFLKGETVLGDIFSLPQSAFFTELDDALFFIEKFNHSRVKNLDYLEYRGSYPKKYRYQIRTALQYNQLMSETDIILRGGCSNIPLAIDRFIISVGDDTRTSKFITRGELHNNKTNTYVRHFSKDIAILDSRRGNSFTLRNKTGLKLSSEECVMYLGKDFFIEKR